MKRTFFLEGIRAQFELNELYLKSSNGFNILCMTLQSIIPMTLFEASYRDLKNDLVFISSNEEFQFMLKNLPSKQTIFMFIRPLRQRSIKSISGINKKIANFTKPKIEMEIGNPILELERICYSFQITFDFNNRDKSYDENFPLFCGAIVQEKLNPESHTPYDLSELALILIKNNDYLIHNLDYNSLEKKFSEFRHIGPNSLNNFIEKFKKIIRAIKTNQSNEIVVSINNCKGVSKHPITCLCDFFEELEQDDSEEESEQEQLKQQQQFEQQQFEQQQFEQQEYVQQQFEQQQEQQYEQQQHEEYVQQQFKQQQFKQQQYEQQYEQQQYEYEQNSFITSTDNGEKLEEESQINEFCEFTIYPPDSVGSTKENNNIIYLSWKIKNIGNKSCEGFVVTSNNNQIKNMDIQKQDYFVYKEEVFPNDIVDVIVKFAQKIDCGYDRSIDVKFNILTLKKDKNLSDDFIFEIKFTKKKKSLNRTQSTPQTKMLPNEIKEKLIEMGYEKENIESSFRLYTPLNVESAVDRLNKNKTLK